MKKIYFITSNKGKVLEAKEKFSSVGVRIEQKNLGYPEPQVDSLEEVALFGVKHIQNILSEPFILEDAGLFIDTLDGFPGVYSAYVFRTIGCKGILNLLRDVEKRDAVFKSVFAYSEPNKEPILFIGECSGSISKKENGNNGFGYDPIFIPSGEKRTFALMNANEKNRFSHRGKSLEKLLDFLARCE